MFGFIILSFSVLNPVSVFASQSSVSQPVPVDEDEEDRQEVKISRKKLMSCPGCHHQSFHPPFLVLTSSVFRAAFQSFGMGRLQT